MYLFFAVIVVFRFLNFKCQISIRCATVDKYQGNKVVSNFDGFIKNFQQHPDFLTSFMFIIMEQYYIFVLLILSSVLNTDAQGSLTQQLFDAAKNGNENQVS